MIRWLLKLILALLLFLLPAFAYLGWQWWQTRELRTFCAAVQPGMSFAELEQLAAAHRIDAHWVHGPGVLDTERHDWVLYVPAVSTMGDFSCEIRDDQLMVTSAQISESP